MNTNKTKVPTIFGPETGFKVSLVPNTPVWATREARFDRLKERLLLERLNQFQNRDANCRIRRAANEAAALALVTCYPLLVFPSLFEERIECALASGDEQYKDEFGPVLVQI